METEAHPKSNQGPTREPDLDGKELRKGFGDKATQHRMCLECQTEENKMRWSYSQT